MVEDDVSRVSVLGFCMGGHYAFKAASIDRFDAAVSFYGMVRTPEALAGARVTASSRSTSPAEMAPTLAFFGSTDPWTPAADIEALRAAWSGRTDCEIVVVEGAEHGFVHDPDRDVHRADDAARALGPRAAVDRLRLTTRSTRSDSRADLELLAVDDAVAAAARDLEPAELHEQRDRLVHALA